MQRFNRFAVDISGRRSDSLPSLKAVVAVARDLLGEGSVNIFFTRAQAAWKRRFIILEKGYIGLGPRQMQVNDKVVLLQGRKTPLMVRPSLV